MTLASRAEFARIIGKSKPYVTQLGSEGRLVMVGKLVDVEASQARIAATAAGTHPGVTARHAQERAQKTAAGAFSAGGEGVGMGEAEKTPQAPDAAMAGSDSGRLMVRKMREMLMRDDRLIDLGLLRGEMMPRGDMNHMWHDMGVAIRAGMEAMIERLAPRLSASADGAAVASDIRLAMVSERRRVKRLMVSSLKQTRESGK
jgi:hypothetical protein